MKKKIEKLIILILIFIAAVGVMMVSRNSDERTNSYVKMGAATLPVVSLVYNGREVNELHGYTAELEVSTFRETVFPLSEDRVLPVRIDTFGSEVTAVEYEVRSLDGSHLIERNTAETLTVTSENELETEVILMDLLETGESYLVTFILYDDEQELGRYYIRVREERDTAVAGALEFALDFSEKTFLQDPDEMIMAQLESKPGTDNSNYGYADIYSSYSHVLWGTLSPKRDSEVRIQIHEFDRLMTSLTLSYEMTATGTEGQPERYQVEEAYSVRLVNGKYYLMTYERLTNQQFSGTDMITDEGDLFLGVQGPEQVPVQVVRDKKRIVFVQAGDLRCYDNEAGRLKTLFTFRDGEDIRTEYDRHDIRIVHLEDCGDVEFLVYGYMNRGVHEGETGISFYRYHAASDSLEEVFYIASRQNDQQLRAELGSLCYMSDNGLFYLMYEGTVYAIDIEGGEYVMLASDVRAGGLAVDEKSGVAAWQERDERDRITVYYLNTGESWTINGPEGDEMKLMGFIDGDLLYGLSRKENQLGSYPDSLTAPLYALEIMNMEGAVETRYEKEGIYLFNVEILSDRIRFDRQRLNGNVWEAMEGDVLFCKEEDKTEAELLLETSASERQKLTYTLNLAMKEDAKVVSGMPKLLEEQAPVIALNGTGKTEQTHYYAYSYGRLCGVFETPAQAIAAVEKDMGVVTNDCQQMVWNRGNLGTSAQVSLPFAEPKDSPQMSDYLDLFLRKLGTETDDVLLNLEGCTLNQILYYLYEGELVLGVDSSNQAVLLVGYYEIYGETIVLYYNLENGKVEEVGFEEADSWFSGSGNRFVSVLP